MYVLFSRDKYHLKDILSYTPQPTNDLDPLFWSKRFQYIELAMRLSRTSLVPLLFPHISPFTSAGRDTEQ